MVKSSRGDGESAVAREENPLGIIQHVPSRRRAEWILRAMPGPRGTTVSGLALSLTPGPQSGEESCLDDSWQVPLRSAPRQGLETGSELTT